MRLNFFHKRVLQRLLKDLKDDLMLAEFGSRPRLEEDIKEMKELLDRRISRQSSFASSFKKGSFTRKDSSSSSSSNSSSCSSF